MVILIAFVLAPLGAGFVLEYLICRLSMGHGRLWKLLPPVLAAALTGAVALGLRTLLPQAEGRYRVWASAESPLPTLLFVPGLPALLGFLGLLAGWLAWRRMWLPRVVRNKQSE